MKILVSFYLFQESFLDKMKKQMLKRILDKHTISEKIIIIFKMLGKYTVALNIKKKMH